MLFQKAEGFPDDLASRVVATGQNLAVDERFQFGVSETFIAASWRRFFLHTTADNMPSGSLQDISEFWGKRLLWKPLPAVSRMT